MGSGKPRIRWTAKAQGTTENLKNGGTEKQHAVD